MPAKLRTLPLWQRIVMWMLGITTALMLLFDTALFTGMYVTPNSVKSRFIQLKSEKIPKALDQCSIVYLSDIEYGSQFPKSRGDDLFGEIARLDPDILLIGGDLFAAEDTITAEQRSQMVEWLNSIKAPNGKFAVYGEQDLCDSDHSIAVNDVYYKSEVEVLDNKSTLLSNHSRNGIRLVGLGLDPTPEAIAPSIGSDQYVLLLSHYPDNLLEVEGSTLHPDLALCGNAHGSQIKWPFIGNYRIFEGSQTINRSRQQKLSFPYTITSGVGCIDIQARINSPVEFLYYTLFSEAADAGETSQMPDETGSSSALPDSALPQTTAPDSTVPQETEGAPAEDVPSDTAVPAQ